MASAATDFALARSYRSGAAAAGVGTFAAGTGREWVTDSKPARRGTGIRRRDLRHIDGLADLGVRFFTDGR